MIQVTIRQGTLKVHFASWARLFSGASTVSVPVDGIREARHLDRPLAAATGWRAGLVVSGVMKVGVWTSFGGVRRLVAARHGEPGLRIVMKDRRSGYDELVLSVRDAEGSAGPWPRWSHDRRPGARPDQEVRTGSGRHRPQLRRRARGRSPASSGPTARARPPPCGCCSVWSPRPPAPPRSAAGATPTCPGPRRPSARCWTARASIPPTPPCDHLRVYARMGGYDAGPRRAGGRGDRGVGVRPARHARAVHRHAAAAQPRHRPARRPPGAAARRAGQRPRPRGHRLAARIPAGAGRAGLRGAGLQPPARRGRAGGRPGRGDPAGAAGRDRHHRRAGRRAQRAGAVTTDGPAPDVPAGRGGEVEEPDRAPCASTA